MARLRILPLPGDGHPFAVVIDRADDYTMQLLAYGTMLGDDGIQRPTRDSLKDALGARAILTFEGDLELPGDGSHSGPASWTEDQTILRNITKGVDWIQQRYGAGDPEAARGQTQSCRSEEGITVGLVDAIIAINRVLAERDLSTANVQEALADLLEDPDLQTIRDARQAATGTS